jgi:GDP-L-fucose synthase
MRVLVTGGTGFLGKHLVQKLWERGGYDVQVAELKDFDLRYSGHVDEMYERTEPEIVINLAASVGGISANIARPAEFFYNNLMMGMNVLEGARAYGVQKFVQIGSACEYPKNIPVPFKEADIWHGYPEDSNAAYGIAKRALLTMGQAYRKQYSMNVIHLLPTNLYGPGDNFGENSHFIPAMIERTVQAVKNNLPAIKAWGTGSATRDFLYVEDAAEGIIAAMENYNSGEPINLGSGREHTIKETAQKIAWLSGFEGEILWDTSKTDGQPRRVLDVSKAKEFGWEASTLLEAGLARTVEWYRAKSR